MEIKQEWIRKIYLENKDRLERDFPTEDIYELFADLHIKVLNSIYCNSASARDILEMGRVQLLRAEANLQEEMVKFRRKVREAAEKRDGTPIYDPWSSTWESIEYFKNLLDRCLKAIV